MNSSGKVLNSLLSTFRSTFNNLINKVCAFSSARLNPRLQYTSFELNRIEMYMAMIRRLKCVCHSVQCRHAINYLRALRDGRSARRSPRSTRRHPACLCGKPEASTGNREKPLRLINQEITRYAGLRRFFVSSLIGLVSLAA